MPNIFNSSEDFSQWFNKPFESSGDSTADQVSFGMFYLRIDVLKTIVTPVALKSDSCVCIVGIYWQGLTLWGGESIDHKPSSPSSSTICPSEAEA